METGPVFCLAMAVVVIVVMVTIMVAFGAGIFQLTPRLLCLPAVFTMTPLCLVQPLFGLLNPPLAFIVTVSCVSRDRNAHQQRHCKR